MEQAIINALKRRRELQKQLMEIEQFLRLYEEFSGESAGRIEDKTPVEEPTPDTTKKTGTKHIRIGPKAVVDVSTGILQDFGEPLTRGELAAELGMRGVLMPSKDKESRARYVGTILWRNSDHFENIEGKGYWLKGEPIPETEQEKRALRLKDKLI